VGKEESGRLARDEASGNGGGEWGRRRVGEWHGATEEEWQEASGNGGGVGNEWHEWQRRRSGNGGNGGGVATEEATGTG
jgi:hypothetical protein